MARLAVINRELKRINTVKKYAAEREKLKQEMRNPKASEEVKDAARQKFNSLPRNASPCRLRNRCRITGRPHGVYRKFGLSRNKLRKAAMRGDVPGLVKASW